VQGTEAEEGSVQVSVLVAMPSFKSKFKSKSLSGDEEAETVPEMVVGVVHLPYRISTAVSSSQLNGRGD